MDEYRKAGGEWPPLGTFTQEELQRERAKLLDEFARGLPQREFDPAAPIVRTGADATAKP